MSKLTAQQRKNLDKSDFVFPMDRKYPNIGKKKRQKK